LRQKRIVVGVNRGVMFATAPKRDYAGTRHSDNAKV
jgi:hypothetical protein